MSLFTQWQKKQFSPAATAIVATVATDKGQKHPKVAKVASVAVASTPKTPIEHLEGDGSTVATVAEVAVAKAKTQWITKGLTKEQADKLHEVLVKRDRSLDDRRNCIECQHSYMGRCKAGLSPIGWSDAYTLHRCRGFIEG